MSAVSHSGKHAELYHLFRDQIDLIKLKRTALIKLSNFPQDISLSTICEVLAEYLLLFNPPISLERLLLADNALTTLPSEIELLCGICMRYLDLHNNNFYSIPSVIGNCCPRLEGLDLSLNHLSSLPRHVFLNLPDLKVLLLKNNDFNYLPPFLGEMINLEAIGVAENPLLMPTIDVIKSMPGGTNDLKAYLLSNSTTLDQHIQNLVLNSQRAPSTPSVARTRSLSDTRSKSLKASRRMGLIINSNKTTPDDAPRTGSSLGSSIDSFTPSKPERKPLLPDNDNSDLANLLERSDPSFQLELTSGPTTYTTSTATRSRSTSPSGGHSTSAPSRAVRSRSRSNTLKEINAMLENSELGDSDHKSGAYFRRLSTLQERPSDEAFRASQEELTAISRDEENSKRSAAPQNTQDVSPLKQALRKASINSHTPGEVVPSHVANSSHFESHGNHDLGTVLKVARKVLYSFSEVHSSIKRFTGFCSDRRVTLKVVPLLHMTKGNIDSLVETMEAVEDNAENQDAIMNAVHACITTFKQIFEIVIENFPSFVAKIDVCFIRMVYLTLYGSLNEVQNAYKLLNPFGLSAKVPATLARNQSGLALPTLDPKKQLQSAAAAEEFLAINGDQNGVQAESEQMGAEGIDEKLYQCIDLATANAQIVFSELTKAIGKSAIASANTNGTQPMNPAVSTKFKELANVCISSMEITKRLTSKLSTIRTNQTQAMRRLFWDDTNLFLKAILQTFSSVKGIMKDAPILNEVRQSMASLTKTTKDLTIFLEASSYKSMSDSTVLATHLQASLVSAMLTPTAPSSLSSLHSSSAINLPQLGGSVALVRTPLVATVGAAAAQAILPHSDSGHNIISSAAGNPPAAFTIPPLVSTDVLNTGLHTAPVQSMEQYYAKNVNPFDRI